jgi:hypothetical protein
LIFDPVLRRVSNQRKSQSEFPKEKARRSRAGFVSGRQQPVRPVQAAFRAARFAALASRFLALSALRWRAWIFLRRELDIVGMEISVVDCSASTPIGPSL